jgi:hypothetical protein
MHALIYDWTASSLEKPGDSLLRRGITLLWLDYTELEVTEIHLASQGSPKILNGQAT